MIYMEPSRLGWRPLVTSWLNRDFTGQEQRKVLNTLFDFAVQPLLTFIRNDCVELTITSDSNLVSSLMNMIEAALARVKRASEATAITPRLIHGIFVFSTIWSIGATVNESGRVKFSIFLRTLLAGSQPGVTLPEGLTIETPIPEPSTVYDYLFDTELNGGSWRLWLDTIPAEVEISPKARFSEIIVPTLDTARYTYLLRMLVENGRQVMFVGPTGTGKTLYITEYDFQYDLADSPARFCVVCRKMCTSPF
jgi:dynein heavy chain